MKTKAQLKAEGYLFGKQHNPLLCCMETIAYHPDRPGDVVVLGRNSGDLDAILRAEKKGG